MALQDGAYKIEEMKRGIDIMIAARAKQADQGLELLQNDLERLTYENDTLKAFIIDMYNESPPEQFNILLEARDYIKQLNKTI